LLSNQEMVSYLNQYMALFKKEILKNQFIQSKMLIFVVIFMLFFIGSTLVSSFANSPITSVTFYINAPDTNICNESNLSIITTNNAGDYLYNLTINYTLPANTSLLEWFVSGNTSALENATNDNILIFNTTNLSHSSTLNIILNLKTNCSAAGMHYANFSYYAEDKEGNFNNYTKTATHGQNIFTPSLTLKIEAVAVNGQSIVPTQTPKATVGDILTWRVTLKNEEQGNASNVWLNITNSVGFEELSAISNANCNKTDQNYSCIFAALASNEILQMNYNMTIASCEPEKLIIEGMSSYGCDDGCRIEEHEGKGSATVILKSPKLETTILDKNAPKGCHEGNLTLQVKNIGDEDAKNISLQFNGMWNYIYNNISSTPNFDAKQEENSITIINFSSPLQPNATINITLYYNGSCQRSWEELKAFIILYKKFKDKCDKDNTQVFSAVGDSATFPDVRVTKTGPIDLAVGNNLNNFTITVKNFGSENTNTTSKNVEVEDTLTFPACACGNGSCFKVVTNYSDNSDAVFISSEETNTTLKLKWNISNIPANSIKNITFTLHVNNSCRCRGLAVKNNVNISLAGCDYCSIAPQTWRYTTQSKTSKTTCPGGFGMNKIISPQRQESCHDYNITASAYTTNISASYTDLTWSECFMKNNFHYHDTTARFTCAVQVNVSSSLQTINVSFSKEPDYYSDIGGNVVCANWNLTNFTVISELPENATNMSGCILNSSHPINATYNITVGKWDVLDIYTRYIFESIIRSETDGSGGNVCHESPCERNGAHKNLEVKIFKAHPHMELNMPMMHDTCSQVPISLYLDEWNILGGAHDLIWYVNISNWNYTAGSSNLTLKGKTTQTDEYMIDNGPYINNTQSFIADPEINCSTGDCILKYNLSALSDGNDTFFYDSTLTLNATPKCNSANSIASWINWNDGCKTGYCKLNDTSEGTDNNCSECGCEHSVSTSQSLVLTKPLLSITFDRKPDIVSEDIATYEIIVKNLGPGAAYNAIVNITFDEGMEYSNWSAPIGSNISLIENTSKYATFSIDKIEPSSLAKFNANATVTKCSNMSLFADVKVGCFDVECSNSSASSYAIIKTPITQVSVSEMDSVTLCITNLSDPNFTSNLSIEMKGETSLYNVTINYLPFVGFNVTQVTINESVVSPITYNPDGSITFVIDKIKKDETVQPFFKYNATSCCSPSQSQSKAKITYQTVCQFAEGSTGTTLEKYSPTFVVLDPEISITKTPLWIAKENKSQIIWNITVKNTGNADAYGINITDLLPINTLFDSTNCESMNGTTGGSGTSDDLFWCALNTLANHSQISINITANITGCNLTTKNNATVCWGCYSGNCNCTIGCASTTSDLDTQPIMRIASISAPEIGPCEEKNITFNINTNVLPAHNWNINTTLGNDLRYANLWWVVGNSTQVDFEQINNQYILWNGSSQTNNTNMQIIVSVRAFNSSEQCIAAASGNVSVNLTYFDSCSEEFSDAKTTNINYTNPSINLEVANTSQTVNFGENRTWTIKVTNNGGPAYNLTILHSLAEGFSDLWTNVSGEINEINRTINWTIDLLAGKTWSAQVKAKPTCPVAYNSTTFVNGSCANCNYATTINQTTNSTIIGANAPFIIKERKYSNLSIGEKQDYIITTEIKCGTIENITINDYLESRLHYINGSATCKYTNTTNSNYFCNDSTLNCSVLNETTESLLWQCKSSLGNISAPITIIMNHSTFVENISTNTNSTQLKNRINTSYYSSGPEANEFFNSTNQGAETVNETSTTFTVLEPNIVANKTRTSDTPVSIDDIINYTISLKNNGSSTAWNITIIDYIPDGLIYNSSEIIPLFVNTTIIIQNISKINVNETVNFWLAFKVNETYRDNKFIVAGDNIGANQLNIIYYSTNQTKADEYNGTAREYSTDANSNYSLVQRGIIIAPPTFYKYTNQINASLGQPLEWTIITNTTRGGVKNLTLFDNSTNFNITAIENCTFTYLNSTAASCVSNCKIINNNTVYCNFSDVRIGILNLNFEGFVNNASNLHKGSILYNFANITYYNSTNETFKINANASIVILEPNITISKTVNPQQQAPGFPINYTITIKNEGNSIAYNVSVLDYLPDGTEFLSNSTSKSTDAFDISSLPDRRNLTYFFSNVNVSETIIITISARVKTKYDNNSDVIIGDYLLNKADAVSMSWNSQNSRNYTTNASADLLVVEPNLLLSITQQNNSLPSGAINNYTFYLCNYGNSTTYNISFNATLLSGVVFINWSATTTPISNSQINLSDGSQMLLYMFDNLTNGSCINISVLAFINNTYSNNTFLNQDDTVQISANLSGWSAPSNGHQYNHTNTISTNVELPNIIITKTSISESYPNQNITYNISICNAGKGVAYNITTTDILANGTTFLNATPTPNSTTQINNRTRTLIWKISSIENNTCYTITINASINETYEDTNISGTYKQGEYVRAEENLTNHINATYLSYISGPYQEFNTLTNHTMKMQSVVLEILNISIPSKVYPCQDFTGNLTIKNTGNITAYNVIAHYVMNGIYFVDVLSLKFSNNISNVENEWSAIISKIVPNETLNITFIGRPHAINDTINATLFITDDTIFNTRNSTIMNVSAPHLVLDTKKISDKIEYKKEVEYQINITNKGNDIAKNVIVFVGAYGFELISTDAQLDNGAPAHTYTSFDLSQNESKIINLKLKVIKYGDLSLRFENKIYCNWDCENKEIYSLFYLIPPKTSKYQHCHRIFYKFTTPICANQKICLIIPSNENANCGGCCDAFMTNFTLNIDNQTTHKIQPNQIFCFNTTIGTHLLTFSRHNLYNTPTIINVKNCSNCTCGDKVCDSTCKENYKNSLEDYSKIPVCRDEKCEGNETCLTCETDCGKCNATKEDHIITSLSNKTNQGQHSCCLFGLGCNLRFIACWYWWVLLILAVIVGYYIYIYKNYKEYKKPKIKNQKK